MKEPKTMDMIPLVTQPGHGITRCIKCDTIIKQCRCMNHRDISYSSCQPSCSAKKVETDG